MGRGALPRRGDGLSWFGVVRIFTAPSGPTASQAQPEPKTPAAEAANFALNSSYEPKAWGATGRECPRALGVFFMLFREVLQKF